MKRTTLNEKQRAVALLVAQGQHSYRDIARMAGLHRNSIRNFLRDERVQKLVAEFQQHIQHKLESLAIEATYRKNGPLVSKATAVLEGMLEGKSHKRQMDAIAFLLGGPMAHQTKQDAPQEERPSRIRLEHRPGPRTMSPSA